MLDASIRRIYLAGPMAGLAEHNFPLFNRVAEHLRRRGFEVFNPAKNDDGGVRQTRGFYMRLDIPALMASDAVVVLPNWQDSRGANLEVWLALDLEMPVVQPVDLENPVEFVPVEGLEPVRLPFADMLRTTAAQEAER